MHVTSTKNIAVFLDVPVVGFRKCKSLEEFLVRAKLPANKCNGSSGPCDGKRCDVCRSIVPSNT